MKAVNYIIRLFPEESTLTKKVKEVYDEIRKREGKKRLIKAVLSFFSGDLNGYSCMEDSPFCIIYQLLFGHLHLRQLISKISLVTQRCHLPGSVVFFSWTTSSQRSSLWFLVLKEIHQRHLHHW